VSQRYVLRSGFAAPTAISRGSDPRVHRRSCAAAAPVGRPRRRRYSAFASRSANRWHRQPALRDAGDDELLGRQPERQVAAVMLEQHTLGTARCCRRPLMHHGGRRRGVGVDILGAEPFGQPRNRPHRAHCIRRPRGLAAMNSSWGQRPSRLGRRGLPASCCRRQHPSAWSHSSSDFGPDFIVAPRHALG